MIPAEETFDRTFTFEHRFSQEDPPETPVALIRQFIQMTK
jgi:hypothetical protein